MVPLDRNFNDRSIGMISIVLVACVKSTLLIYVYKRQREIEKRTAAITSNKNPRRPAFMNENNCVCNQNQMSKNLPLKKRRAYLIDPPLTNDENSSKIIKPSYSQDDSCSVHVPTPPSSPHIDFAHQQHAYLSGNASNNLPQNYHYLMAQQYLDHYRFLFDQQHPYGYNMMEDQPKRSEFNIDEHFRKSLAGNSHAFTDRCLTPDDSSSNGSPIERTPVDSIEEHFARSLAKFRPSTDDENSLIYHQITESVVDDHFAKALGSTLWGKLKEKS